MKSRKLPITAWHIVIVALFAAGLGLRLVGIRHMDMLAGDEGVQLITAERLLDRGEIPIAGEISGLDAESRFIVHNSPLGYYFLSVVYFLGLRTPEGYVLVYALLSLLPAWALFAAATRMFGKNTGLLTLVIALFGGFALWASGWPSQPANAVIFESIAILFAAYFLTTRNPQWLIVAWAATMAATQMYPPMYLLLPLKLVLLFKSLSGIREWKKALFWICSLSALVFLPLFILEATTGVNTDAVRGYIASHALAPDSIPFWHRFALNMQQGLSGIVGGLVTPTSVFIFIVLVFLFLLSARNERKHTHFVGWLLVLVLATFSVMAMLPTAGDYLVPDRAYLTILVPHITMLLGWALGFLAVGSWATGAIAMLVGALLLHSSVWAIAPRNAPTIYEIRQVAEAMALDAQMRMVDYVDIDVFVISSGDEWSWEGSIYWYELERIAGRPLVAIDFASSKAKRLKQETPALVYLVCHGIEKKRTVEKCFGSFLMRSDSLYGAVDFLGREEFPHVEMFITRPGG